MARRQLYRQCLYEGQAWMRRACLFGDTCRIIGVDMRDWKEDRMNTASENTEKMSWDAWAASDRVIATRLLTSGRSQDPENLKPTGTLLSTFQRRPLADAQTVWGPTFSMSWPFLGSRLRTCSKEHMCLLLFYFCDQTLWPRQTCRRKSLFGSYGFGGLGFMTVVGRFSI